MELGLIPDDRDIQDQEYQLKLTPKGERLLELLEPVVKGVDLSFAKSDEGSDEDEEVSWRMTVAPKEFNRMISQHLQRSAHARTEIRRIFLSMEAVKQMLSYLYRVERKKTIRKTDIYHRFFKWDPVKEYADRQGIEDATDVAAEHRCPFLLNILESLGIISQSSSDVTVELFLICEATVSLTEKQKDEDVQRLILRLSDAWKSKADQLDESELSMLREYYGKNFLTGEYYLDNAETVPVPSSS
jgi:hypothetical protein